MDSQDLAYEMFWDVPQLRNPCSKLFFLTTTLLSITYFPTKSASIELQEYLM